MPSVIETKKKNNKFSYLKRKLIKKISELHAISNTFVKIRILRDGRQIFQSRLEENEGPTGPNLTHKRIILSNELSRIAENLVALDPDIYTKIHIRVLVSGQVSLNKIFETPLPDVNLGNATTDDDIERVLVPGRVENVHTGSFYLKFSFPLNSRFY